MEIATALQATYRIALRDRAGAWILDDSVVGFLKSFFAAIIIAPLYALVVMIRSYLDQPPDDMVGVMAIEGVAYLVGWLVWPVLSFEIARFFSVRAAWRRYVVAYNWSHVWIMLLQLPLLALSQSGIVGSQAGSFAMIVTVLLVVVYRFLLARDVLGIDRYAAMGVSFLDLVVSVAWSLLVIKMVAPYVGLPDPS
ncbi:MAG: hypothetical protein P1U65_02425 [Minwuia sp.]|nr:hypothetical protein [Minwuia sp.]